MLINAINRTNQQAHFGAVRIEVPRPANEELMNARSHRVLAAVLITFGLLVGTAAAMTAGSIAPDLRAIG
jgi:hypothetical protein